MREEVLMRLISDSYNIIGRPFMARAFDLALEGARTAAPNPLVGCVIVSQGVIVGEGFHSRAGSDHAEIMALKRAGEKAKGASVYVTLEPCSHVGQTGPCVQALIDAGVARVVIGMPDPTAEASGGAEVLKEAGIAVEFVSDPRPFEELNRGWIKRKSTGLPGITMKIGVSLDAALTVRRDGPTVITGPSGAEVTRRLRSAADAVLVSASTAQFDNPSLTIRGMNGEPEPNQPKRIILVRSQVPEKSLKVFSDGLAETIILCRDSQDVSVFDGYGAEIVTYSDGEGLRGAFKALGDYGINSLLVEPGQRLFTDMINSRLVDELVTVSAGGFLGSDSLKCYDGIATIQNSSSPIRVMEHRFVPFDTKIFGDVVATMWRPRGSRER